MYLYTESSETTNPFLNKDPYPATKPGSRANHKNTSSMNRSETDTSAKLQHTKKEMYVENLKRFGKI